MQNHSPDHSFSRRARPRNEKRVFRQMWTTSELRVVQELHTWALSENVSGTMNSQLADDFHEVFHFSIDGCSTHSEVLLHADASKEGQDHLREYRWFHLRFLGFDVSRDQISETSVAFGNDLLRRTGITANWFMELIEKQPF